jgi:quinol monooxygenase YgiN
MNEHEGAGEGEGRLVALVEWNAPRMTLDEARELALGTAAQLRRVPGLVDLRFFGDFEAGVHYYLLTWESRAALDAYMASASMFQIRDLAAPHVEGRPSRRVLIDYSPAHGAGA